MVPVEYGISINADRQLLASAVSNLLQNAFKFTHSGGHVALRAQKKMDRVFIEIEDECGGLPAGQTEELFRTFGRRHADKTGLGLGLAISRRSVTVNGGELQVKNMPGKGCIFSIDLAAGVLAAATPPRAEESVGQATSPAWPLFRSAQRPTSRLRQSRPGETPLSEEGHPMSLDRAREGPRRLCRGIGRSRLLYAGVWIHSLPPRTSAGREPAIAHEAAHESQGPEA